MYTAITPPPRPARKDGWENGPRQRSLSQGTVISLNVPVLCGLTLHHESQYPGRGSLETRLTLKEGGAWSRRQSQWDTALGQACQGLLVSGTKPSQSRVGREMFL